MRFPAKHGSLTPLFHHICRVHLLRLSGVPPAVYFGSGPAGHRKGLRFLPPWRQAGHGT